jgi:hypothetical protein
MHGGEKGTGKVKRTKDRIGEREGEVEGKQ